MGPGGALAGSATWRAVTPQGCDGPPLATAHSRAGFAVHTESSWFARSRLLANIPRTLAGASAVRCGLGHPKGAAKDLLCIGSRNELPPGCGRPPDGRMTCVDRGHRVVDRAR